jgi:opacity protein-like surface antigen
MAIRKTIKTIALLSCMFPIAFNAIAIENTSNISMSNFVTVKVGLNNSKVTTKNNNAGVDSVDYSYLAGVELGRKITDIFSVGIEYNYKSKSDLNIPNYQGSRGSLSSNWKVRSSALMLNISADLMQKSKITPYVKLGVGLSRNTSYSDTFKATFRSGTTLTATSPGETKNNFAWQAGLGVTMDYNERISTDISYSFMNRGKFTTKQYINVNNKNYILAARTIKLQDQIIAVGLKVKF